MSLVFLDLPASHAHATTVTTRAKVGSGVEASMGSIVAGYLMYRHCAGATIDAMSAATTPSPASPIQCLVRIQAEDFDVGTELQALRAGDARVGAVCSFVGTVRDRHGSQAAAGSVQSMELEHYPGMTEKSIETMVAEAFARFDIFGARVVHRVGLLQPCDQVVLVAVTSAHRGESFQACEFLMDYLKTQAPFWKKEQTPEGARWVDARVSDDTALARWGIVATNA
jgi:molybdopterin synthase catalytic subunit